MRERAFGPEVRDPQGLLQGEASAHDLAVDGSDGFGGKASRPRGQPVENQPLARGIVRRQARGALGLGHIEHHVGPLVEHLEDPVVELVDALSQVFERHGSEP